MGLDDIEFNGRLTAALTTNVAAELFSYDPMGGLYGNSNRLRWIMVVIFS